MSGKGDVLADEEYKGKVMWVFKQVDVLSKLDKGLSIGVVRHHYDVNILTIHLIKENENKGRWNVNAHAAFCVKISCGSHRDSFLEKVEKILCAWLSDGDGCCHTNIRKYMRACKRRQSCKRAPVSSPSLLSGHPSGTVCHLITLTVLARNTDFISLKTNTNVFAFISGYFTCHILCLWFS
jgi:hypothetical protein